MKIECHHWGITSPSVLAWLLGVMLYPGDCVACTPLGNTLIIGYHPSSASGRFWHSGCHILPIPMCKSQMLVSVQGGAPAEVGRVQLGCAYNPAAAVGWMRPSRWCTLCITNRLDTWGNCAILLYSGSMHQIVLKVPVGTAQVA